MKRIKIITGTCPQPMHRSLRHEFLAKQLLNKDNKTLFIDASYYRYGFINANAKIEDQNTIVLEGVNENNLENILEEVGYDKIPLKSSSIRPVEWLNNVHTVILVTDRLELTPRILKAPFFSNIEFIISPEVDNNNTGEWSLRRVENYKTFLPATPSPEPAQ